MMNIIFGIFYPLVLITAIYKSVEKYLDVVVSNNCTFKAYTKGIKMGYEEFFESHKRIYTRYKQKCNE